MTTKSRKPLDEDEWEYLRQLGERDPFHELFDIADRLQGASPLLQDPVPLWDGAVSTSDADDLYWVHENPESSCEPGHGAETPDWFPTMKFGDCVFADFAFGEQAAPYLIVAQEVDVNGYDALALLKFTFQDERGWVARQFNVEGFRDTYAFIEVLHHYEQPGFQEDFIEACGDGLAHPPLLRFLPEMDGCDVHHVRVVIACLEDAVRVSLRRSLGALNISGGVEVNVRSSHHHVPQRAWEYVARHRRRLAAKARRRKAHEDREKEAAEQRQQHKSLR